MELRHLKYFIAVAEWKGFSHAARRLYVSQSAISEQISDLEKEIGVQLLLRNRRQVTLTDSGNVFLEEAKKSYPLQIRRSSLLGDHYLDR
jgi:DNA-binding transcriptional LysR family regulator